MTKSIVSMVCTLVLMALLAGCKGWGDGDGMRLVQETFVLEGDTCVTTYEYDQQGRLVCDKSANTVTTYDYNNRGQLTCRTTIYKGYDEDPDQQNIETILYTKRGDTLMTQLLQTEDGQLEVFHKMVRVYRREGSLRYSFEYSRYDETSQCSSTEYDKYGHVVRYDSYFNPTERPFEIAQRLPANALVEFRQFVKTNHLKRDHTYTYKWQ